MLTIATAKVAYERIKPLIRHTPLLPLPNLTDQLPANLRLKLENLQVTGSFKVRGALNNLLLATPEEQKRGVIVASGGNHGLSIAYAANRLSIPATVVLPATAAEDRVRRIQAWGATVLAEGKNPSDAMLRASALAAEQGLLYIHPFESEKTWHGTATVGLEIIEDISDVDCVLVAIGGGGLICGVAAVIKEHNPKAKIIGVEPTGAAKMTSALRGDGLVELLYVQTIADTLAPRVAVERTLEMTRSHVDEIVLVSDHSMIDAMRFLWRESNQLVEPAGAAVIAAVLGGHVDLSSYRNPIAIICGGNASAETVFKSYAERANEEEPEEEGVYNVSTRVFSARPHRPRG